MLDWLIEYWNLPTVARNLEYLSNEHVYLWTAWQSNTSVFRILFDWYGVKKGEIIIFWKNRQHFKENISSLFLCHILINREYAYLTVASQLPV